MTDNEKRRRTARKGVGAKHRAPQGGSTPTSGAGPDTRLRRKRFRKRSDIIAEEMKRWIVVDRKQPGDRLPQEHELTQLFDTSRWTIREALKSLEVQGLISVSSGASGGARIAEVTLQNATQLLANYFYFKPLTVAHIYSMRKVLEPMLVAEVIDHLTQEDLRALADNVELTKRLPRSEEERREHRTAELDFHNILADACRNLMLAFICRFINDLLKDWVVFNRTYVEAGEEFSHENLDCHAALLDALRRGDRESAMRLMTEHMEQAAHHTIEMKGEIEVKFLPA